MLWGMDNDYHHLQTRKLKFREMKCLARGCTDIHMPVLLKCEARQFWCQSPTPTRSRQHHSTWSSTTLFTHLSLSSESSRLLKRSDSSQISGCDTVQESKEVLAWVTSDQALQHRTYSPLCRWQSLGVLVWGYDECALQPLRTGLRAYGWTGFYHECPTRSSHRTCTWRWPLLRTYRQPQVGMGIPS